MDTFLTNFLSNFVLHICSINVQLYGDMIDLAMEVEMFVLFQESARVSISYEVLGLEDGVTINASPRR